MAVEEKRPALAAAVGLIALLVYLPALDLRYVGYDDALYIQQNRHIAKLDLETVKWAFYPDEFRANNYHPLTWLSHAADVAVFGLREPMGHHLVNIVLHALDSALVVFVAYGLLGWRTVRWPEGLLRGESLRLAAALTGIGFAVHPLHVESVAWLAERKDVLCGLFYLLSIVLYLSYVRRFESRRAWRLRYGEMVLAALLAFLSKPMAVTLPFVLVLLDIYPLRRFRAREARINALLLVEKLPVLAMTAASCVVTVHAQTGAVAGFKYSIPSRLFTAVWAYVFYLEKFLWPQDLAPLYYVKFNFRFAPTNFAEGLQCLGELLARHPEVMVNASILVVLVATALLTARRWPGPAAALAAYLGMLFPVIGIVQVGLQSAADRYMYLPSIPLLLLLGSAFGWAYQWTADAVILRSAVASVAAVGCIGWSVATIQQIPIWTDAVTLWSTCYQRTLDDEGRSENPQATYNYAQTLIQRGEPDDFVKARPLLEGLLHWHSAGSGYRRPEVLGQLSRIYVREGKYDIAKQYATQSLDSLSPEKRKQQEDEFIVLGLVALHENDPKEAEGHFRAALRARSYFPEAYYDLARAQSRDARTDEALESMKTALDQGYLDTLPAKQLSDLRNDADLTNLRASLAYQRLLEEQEEKLRRRGDELE